MNAAALITAAGVSSRIGGGKKEYHLLDTQTVLSRTCTVFLATALFSRIYITIPPGDNRLVEEILSAGGVPRTEVSLVTGGETRQQSVRAGLEAISAASGEKPEWVLIHDGARPWVSGALIRTVLDGAVQFGGCAPVIPPADAIKKVDENGRIQAHCSRTETLAVQTPQGFSFPAVLKAHELAARDGGFYVDDTEIYEKYSGKVYTVPGDPENRKITYRHDLYIEVPK